MAEDLRKSLPDGRWGRLGEGLSDYYVDGLDQNIMLFNLINRYGSAAYWDPYSEPAVREAMLRGHCDHELPLASMLSQDLLDSYVSAERERAKASLLNRLVVRGDNMRLLKAMLLVMVIMNLQPVEAANITIEIPDISFTVPECLKIRAGITMNAFTTLSSDVAYGIVWLLIALYAWMLLTGKTYWNLPTEDKFLIECIVLSILLVIRLLYRTSFVLVSQSETKQDTPQLTVLEMAMPGSDFSPSKKRQVGAICVKTDHTKIAHRGLFWRVGDYLVTARHVADGIDATVHQAYLVCNKEEDRKFRLNLSDCRALPEGFFDASQNVFKAFPQFDVFARKIEWGKLAPLMGASKLGRSSYGLTVSSVGYQDGLLVTAVGNTTKGSGPFQLWHTASTCNGFSGSPIFAGNAVVGMHVSASVVDKVGKRNIALRIELINFILNLRQEDSADYCVWKLYENEEFDRVDGKRAVMEEIPYDEDLELDYKFRPEVAEFDNGEVKFGRYWQKKEKSVNIPKLGDKSKWANYSDSDSSEEYRGDYQDESDVAWIEKEPAQAKGYPRQIPKPTAVSQLMDMDEMISLGYDTTKYAYPDYSPEAEEISLKKHLEVHHQAVKMCIKPPSDRELEHVIRLTCDKMQTWRFLVPKGYKSEEVMEKYINSSRIKDSKSPGYPWKDSGYLKNSQVIQDLGVDGLIGEVRRRWNERTDFCVCVKDELNKIHKVKTGMCRLVHGHGLHKLVQNYCLFDPLLSQMSKTWMKNPVKQKFAACNPGHIEHLASAFGRETVWSSDKKNWDFTVSGWLVDAAEEVILRLAEPALGAEEDFEEWKKDVEDMFLQIFTDRVFRCSSGRRFQPANKGIMPSGWLLTFCVNSLFQVILDNMTQIRMNKTDDQISAEALAVLGDDVLQTMKIGDSEHYVEEMAALGIQCEMTSTPEFSGTEFVSKTYRYKSYHWTFEPTRLTKHLGNLMVQKDDNVVETLGNLARDWYWNDRVFRFLRSVFLKWKEKCDDVNVSDFPSMEDLRRRQAGYE
jgi:hypothetical protein